MKELKEVVHFHRHSPSFSLLALGGTDISVARDRVAVNLGERTGNIWIGSLRKER